MRKKFSKRIVAMALMALAVTGLTLALAACAPQPQASTPPASDGATSEQLADTGDSPDMEAAQQIAASLTENGEFPDTRFNSELMHAGKRGCNTCHDLFSKIKGMQLSNSNYQHIWVTAPGYGKEASVEDCLACHRLMRMRTGPNLADLMHASHYNNKTFTDVWDGNCWSCHAIYRQNEQVMDEMSGTSNVKWMLWDEIKYTPAVGGFPVPDRTNDTDATVVDWLNSRGWKDGHMTEMSIDSEMNMTVDFNQDVSNEDDMFVANNWGVIDGPASRTEINIDEYTFTVKGVKNPRTFTLDELKALPQVSMTATQGCYSWAPNTCMVGNIPITGVSLKTLVDECGGLEDGCDLFRVTAHDGWDWTHGWEKYTDVEPVLALTFWGHDLTMNQGYPATLVVPGSGGAAWVKWAVQVEFSNNEAAKAEFGPTNFAKLGMTDYEKFANPLTAYSVNSGWFTPARDGSVLDYQEGQPVHLSGFTWSWYNKDHQLTKVKFSFDYGATWKEFDVPAEFDPVQWTQWDVQWTPPAPGTYVLKVSGEDASGLEPAVPASVIVTVGEDGSVTSSATNGQEA